VAQTKGKTEKKSKKKKKQASSGALKALLFALVVFIIVLTLLTVFKMLNGINLFFPDGKVQTVRNVVIVDDTLVIPEYDDETIDSARQYDVKMNSVWTFPNGRAFSDDAYVENPVSNTNAVYFDVNISGYSGSVMTSPVIPLGGHLENISLDKVLNAGTYNGVLTYYLIGSDGESCVGELQMTLKIVVEK